MRLGALVLSLCVASCTNSSPKPTRADDLPDEEDARGETGDAVAVQEQSSPPPPRMSGEPKMDGDCIAADDPSNKAGGAGPSIARWKDLDLDRLAAVIPSEVGELKAEPVSKIPRGMAGHASPNVLTRFMLPDGDAHLIAIYDMQHRCTCSEGMGARLRTRAQESGKSEAIEVAGRLGTSITNEGGGVSVDIWVADRCQLWFNSPDAKTVNTVLEAVDFKALQALCAERSLRPNPLAGP